MSKTAPKATPPVLRLRNGSEGDVRRFLTDQIQIGTELAESGYT
jgi:hypothetical protein